MTETTFWRLLILWQRHVLLVVRTRFRRPQHAVIHCSMRLAAMFAIPALSSPPLRERLSMVGHSRFPQLWATRSSTRSAILRYTTSARAMALFRTRDRDRLTRSERRRFGAFGHATGSCIKA